MEALLSSVLSTVELLAAARTPAVASWREPEARRALSWGRYCQHIHHRFHSHPAVCTLLEGALQRANQRLGQSVEGYEDLALWDLSRCEQLLLNSLLHNPHTPTPVLKMMLQPDGHVDGREDSSGLCLQDIQRRSACKVLRAAGGGPSMGWSSAAELQGGGPSMGWSSAAELQVQAEMLMERLDALLPAGMEVAEQFLDNMVASAPTCGQREDHNHHMCQVISAALLLTSRKETAEEVLLQFLQRNQALLQQSMCEALSGGRLALTLRRHHNLRAPYLDLLKTWASSMSYDLAQGRWVPPEMSSESSMSFETLSQAFHSLLSQDCPPLRDPLLEDPPLRDPLLEDLHRLKETDGDFDVRGLSVWTDLLADMET